MQVLAHRVVVATEVDERGGRQAQPRLLVRLAQRCVARRLAGLDAALGQVPLALAGDVAEQQLV